jgi:hypothetical protein
VEGAAGGVARPGDGASPAGAAEAAAVAAATETTASDGTRYPHQVLTNFQSSRPVPIPLDQ